MKINYFKRILMTVIAVMFLIPLFAQPAEVFLIGGPLNKNNPNWLLDQKVALTKDAVNPAIFYFKGYLAYNWRGDERGNMKFLIKNDWSGAYHPDSEENLLLTGTTPMRQDGSDTKWFIPSDRSGDGYYELIFDTQAKTLTVDSFRHDLNPEKIYAVGASMPCGWDNNNPMEMTRINPEVAVYSWTGIMNSGDFKFLTPLSIGNWDFSYSATTANEPVSFGNAQNLVFEVRSSDETTFHDFKFIMNETAECTITVDLVNKTMVITKNGELYAQDIWIVGSAVPGGKSKLRSDNIDPLINYHYYGELFVGEYKFSTTENIDATTEFYVPSSSLDAISDNVSVSLTSDETASGWSVSQANSMYKIKYNALTNKYNGSILAIDHVYIVGGATAAGWDAGNAIELTRNVSDQPYLFTFDGVLTINTEGNDRDKFKLLLQKDWGPSSLHPQFENESIADAQYFTDNRSDDYKWTVDEDKQGRYVIKLDVLAETIEAIYHPEGYTGLLNPPMTPKVFTADGKVFVKSETVSVKTIEVFAVDGSRVANKPFTLDATIELPNGIYIVKIQDGRFNTVTSKVSVLK